MSTKKESTTKDLIEWHCFMNEHFGWRESGEDCYTKKEFTARDMAHCWRAALCHKQAELEEVLILLSKLEEHATGYKVSTLCEKIREKLKLCRHEKS